MTSCSTWRPSSRLSTCRPMPAARSRRGRSTSEPLPPKTGRRRLLRAPPQSGDDEAVAAGGSRRWASAGKRWSVLLPFTLRWDSILSVFRFFFLFAVTLLMRQCHCDLNSRSLRHVAQALVHFQQENNV